MLIFSITASMTNFLCSFPLIPLGFPGSHIKEDSKETVTFPFPVLVSAVTFSCLIALTSIANTALNSKKSVCIFSSSLVAKPVVSVH